MARSPKAPARARKLENIHLQGEQVAESDYRPGHCKSYRMVALRKNLTVEKGEHRLFGDVSFFFRITNDRAMSMQQIVFFAIDRCSQENVIGQLKSGVNALRMPPDGMVSNWAYIVAVALAWNLRAWYGLVTLVPIARREILWIEFKRFPINFIPIPCQIVHTGLCLIFRILTRTRHLETFFSTFDHIRQVRFS